jgi:hypothetical protein
MNPECVLSSNSEHCLAIGILSKRRWNQHQIRSNEMHYSFFKIF